MFLRTHTSNIPSRVGSGFCLEFAAHRGWLAARPGQEGVWSVECQDLSCDLNLTPPTSPMSSLHHHHHQHCLISVQNEWTQAHQVCPRLVQRSDRIIIMRVCLYSSPSSGNILQIPCRRDAWRWSPSLPRLWQTLLQPQLALQRSKNCQCEAKG